MIDIPWDVAARPNRGRSAAASDARRITMESTSAHSRSSLSRRAAMGSAGAFAAVLGVSGGLSRATAQATDLSSHPLTGTWLAMANPVLADDPQFPAPSLFAADGTILLVFPASQIGPQGPFFNAPVMGVWEPDGERRGHFTAVQLMSAADGTLLGSATIDGYPEVSEDGQTFIDDVSRVMVTIRDAAGAIVDQVMPTGQPAGRPITAVRMSPGSPGFPETAAEGSPTP
jgi:hypothetical protein